MTISHSVDLAAQSLADLPAALRRLLAADDAIAVVCRRERRPVASLHPQQPIPIGATSQVGFHATHAFSDVAVLLRTFGNTASSVAITLSAHADGEGVAVVGQADFDNVIDNVWVTIPGGAHPPGRYLLSITARTGTPGWALTADDIPAWGLTEIDERDPVVRIDGDAVHLSSRCIFEDEPCKPAVRLRVDWVRDGYGVTASDGIVFDRFTSSGGRYLPAHQLKRLSAWPCDLADEHAFTCHGTDGVALQATSPHGVRATGDMTAEAMAIYLTDFTGPDDLLDVTLTALPASTAVAADLPCFLADDAERAAQLTQFFTERALSWPFANDTSGCAGWKEWMVSMLAWTATSGRDAERESLLSIQQDDSGWVWARTDMPGWVFPDPTRYDTRHVCATATYISGACRYFAWTGDRDFLDAIWPRVLRGLDFLVEVCRLRETGLVVNAIPDQSGRAGSLGTHYWDLCPGGWLDAYTNVYAYNALRQAGRLAAHRGDSARAEDLEILADRLRVTFNRIFWLDAVGRYAQNIDVDGAVHDFGAAYLNLEAVAFGLVPDDRARRIFDWLDYGRVELTNQLLLVPPSGTASELTIRQVRTQSFHADRPFASVALRLTAERPHDARFEVSLIRLTGGSRTVVAGAIFPRWWDHGWAPLEFDTQPPGDYRIRLEVLGGSLAWQPGDATRVHSEGADIAETDGSPNSFVVTSPFREGEADIYRRWQFAPRATTRRNDYWYTFGWSGVETAWETQIQDGGTSLYITAFDVIARAGHDPDAAWSKLTGVLDRWSLPDRLCGGAPMSAGERPQGPLPGQVGVDTPFPESGLVGSAYLYAFVGLDPHPDRLRIRPVIPAALGVVGVDNLMWHGHRLRIRVERDRVDVVDRDTGEDVSCPLHPDSGVDLIKATDSGRLVIFPIPHE